jgi:hypothetical protein
VLYYNKQIVVRIISWILSTSNLANFSNYCGLSFSNFLTCVFNQSCGHCLTSDVLHSTISMNLKLKEENQVVSFESFMDDDSIVTNEYLC